MKITAGELAQVLGVPLPAGLGPECVLDEVTTDSREVAANQLFLALKGDRFDGVDYAAEAVRKGAVAVVAERELPELRHRLFLVPDALKALGLIAGWWRQRMTAQVIAVTGSAGKTTTKNLIASICAGVGATVATFATENNEIGVPKTLLRLRESDRFCVVEFGMRARGEIRTLAEIVRPDVGVITLIGEAHLEYLGSRDAIAQTKAEMLPLLPKNGAAVLPADDFYFALLSGMCPCRVISFGFAEEADVRCLEVLEEQLEHTRARVRIADETLELTVPLPGRHNLHNALAAAAAALAVGCTPPQARSGIESYAGMELRGQIIEGPNGSTIINDAYNASPTSVSAALHVLSRAPGRKFFVFGDMLELGQTGPEQHRRIGELAAEHGVEYLVTVGELAAEAAETAAARGLEVRVANSTEEAAEALGPRLEQGDTVLVKGSRGMRLEQVVGRLVNG